MLRADNDTFRLSAVDASDTDKIRWSMVRPADMVANILDAALPMALRHFYLAATVLTSAEAHNRRLIERMTATGTRNIQLRAYSLNAFISKTVEAHCRDDARLEDREEALNVAFQDILQFLGDLLTQVRAELEFPADGNPAEVTYTLTDEIIELADDPDCQAYLRGAKVGRLLTIAQFERVKRRVTRDCPSTAETIIAKIEATVSREHLSAVSLNTTRDGQMVVSMVNVHGDLLAMEAWKFLQLIRPPRREPLSIGRLDNRGGWLPEPLVRFGNNKVGEILALYTANDSVLHAFCRQEVNTAGGGTRQDFLDKAVFVLDQDFLICLYITLTQLREQAERFQQLREQAEVKVALDVGKIFDPTYFDDEEDES